MTGLGGSSPLYERLSLGIAEDRELLELATHARPGQPAQLLLGCVHWLLLAGTRHPLSAFYPSLAQGPIPDGDPYPSFRDFCLEHRFADLIRLSSPDTRRLNGMWSGG